MLDCQLSCLLGGGKTERSCVVCPGVVGGKRLGQTEAQVANSAGKE